jgi:hypothetical protein
VLLLLILVGVVYSKSNTPASSTTSGTTSTDNRPASPTAPTAPTTPTNPVNGGAQGILDVSSVVDSLIASAGEEKRVIDGTETDSSVMNESDSQISAYGNIYDQSELN